MTATEWQVLVGDVREMLRTLPDESIQTCVTSPPYWGLRDYQVPGQIGLEATPDEYVQTMVQVFREVWRVLRPDGTLFLNLGDSYAGANYRGSGIENAHPKWIANRGLAQNMGKKAPPIPDGLKPKDLVGIPWRVARALQEPYYTGRIRNELDRIWLACAIDSEGCMFLHRRKAGQYNGQGYSRKNDSYGAGLEVANTSEAYVKRCMEITGMGSISMQEKDRRQPLYRWSVRSNECRDIVREVYPYLVAKQHQARLLLGCPSSGPKAEAAHQALILLHNGSATTVDFAEPESMYRPGYYLRSDIIWSKLNPMPESVTDRPTKAHEYIFLLTKAATYFYDADAIREQGPGSHPRGTLRSIIKERNDNDRELLETHPLGRNRRTVWTVATQPYSEAHFATFPPKLIEPCILAGTSERGCCAECGAPWERVVEKGPEKDGIERGKHASAWRAIQGPQRSANGGLGTREHKTAGWQPTCRCDTDAPTVPCTVLDPFSGAGTTGLVALQHGRSYVGVELNADYAEMSRRRILGTQLRMPLELSA